MTGEYIGLDFKPYFCSGNVASWIAKSDFFFGVKIQLSDLSCIEFLVNMYKRLQNYTLEIDVYLYKDNVHLK